MNTDKQTILIVEDDEGLRQIIESDIKRRGYSVFTASGGRDALQIIERNAVDLVLTDTEMPNGDGIELLKKIRERRTSLPVIIFMSGSDLDLLAEEAYALGADAIFSKPFDRKELFGAVAHALLPIQQRFQRQTPRLDAEIPVGIQFLKSNFFEQARTLNLGKGGMFVVLNHQFPEILEPVAFNLNAGARSTDTVKGEGIVRWIRKESSEAFPAGCGVEFTNLDSSSVTLVIELIGKLKPKSFIPKR
jgi:CheY-like chemotaxis protein